MKIRDAEKRMRKIRGVWDLALRCYEHVQAARRSFGDDAGFFEADLDEGSVSAQAWKVAYAHGETSGPTIDAWKADAITRAQEYLDAEDAEEAPKLAAELRAIGAAAALAVKLAAEIEAAVSLHPDDLGIDLVDAWTGAIEEASRPPPRRATRRAAPGSLAEAVEAIRDVGRAALEDRIAAAMYADLLALDLLRFMAQAETRAPASMTRTDKDEARERALELLHE